MKKNIIFHMECMEGMNKLAENTIDLIITSPPYNKAGLTNNKKGNVSYDSFSDSLPDDLYQTTQIDFLNECYRILKPGGSVFYNHKNRHYRRHCYSPIEWIIKSKLNLYQQVIWDKGCSTQNTNLDRFIPTPEYLFWMTKGQTKPNHFQRKKDCVHKSEVWHIKNDTSKIHPAPYPIEFVDAILDNFDPGLLILDPYMGSGTTAISALKHRDEFIGFEISEHYIDIANKRILDHISKNVKSIPNLNTVYNINCLEGLHQMCNECIDLVVTDCPYRIVAGGVAKEKGKCEPNGIFNKRLKATNRIGEKWITKSNGSCAVKEGKMFDYNDIDFSSWIPEVYRVLKKGTHFIVMCNSLNSDCLRQEAEKAGFHFIDRAFWYKDNKVPTPNLMHQHEEILLFGKGKHRKGNTIGLSNVLCCPNFRGKIEKELHPTEKPVELMKLLIMNSSNEGDIVLEPFAGRGSTMVAAIESGRNVIGFEIDPYWFIRAETRIKECIGNIRQSTAFYRKTLKKYEKQLKQVA